jgi:hypothetical protein
LCPLILRHYYEVATIKDRFVAGVSGHGLIYNSKHPWHEIHVERSAPILKRADIEVVTIQDFGWQKETFAPTCELPDVTGVIYMDYRQYAYHSGRSMWVNDKPCLSFTYNFWIGFDSASGIAASINSASKNVKSPYAYSLIVVHAWSHGLDDVAAMVNMFNDNVRVVDPETFIRLYAQNVPHVDAYAMTFMRILVLYGQYIGIAIAVGVGVFIVKRIRKKRKGLKVESEPSVAGTIVPNDTIVSNDDK